MSNDDSTASNGPIGLAPVRARLTDVSLRYGKTPRSTPLAWSFRPVAWSA